MARTTGRLHRSIPPEHGKTSLEWVLRFLEDEVLARDQENDYDRPEPSRLRFNNEVITALGAVHKWIESWEPATPTRWPRPPGFYFCESIWDSFFGRVAGQMRLPASEQLLVFHLVRRPTSKPAELAVALGLTTRAVNKTIAGMVKKGLLTRRRAGVDLSPLRERLSGPTRR